MSFLVASLWTEVNKVKTLSITLVNFAFQVERP